MTISEALRWQAYIRKRGSLHPGRRLEAGFALVAYMVNRTAGGKITLADLMPYEHQRDEELTPERVMAVLKAAHRSSR